MRGTEELVNVGEWDGASPRVFMFSCLDPC